MTILERIKLNSAKHPERVVMRTQYGFGEMTMKWGELDAFSDKLAYYLTKELRTNKPIGGAQYDLFHQRNTEHQSHLRLLDCR